MSNINSSISGESNCPQWVSLKTGKIHGKLVKGDNGLPDVSNKIPRLSRKVTNPPDHP